MNIIQKFNQLSSVSISLVKSSGGIYCWMGNAGMGSASLIELKGEHLDEITILDKYNHVVLEDEPILIPIYLDNDTVATGKVYKVRSISL